MVEVLVVTKEEVLAAGLRSVLGTGNPEGNIDFRFYPDVSALTAEADSDYGGVILAEPDGSRGVSLIMQIRESIPGAKVVLWVRNISVEQAQQAIELGARGVLRKDLSIDLTRRCIEKVSAGEMWFERPLTEALIQARTVNLSRRQRQLLTLISQGLSNKEIASALYLSEGTVKVYLSKLFRKLGARDRFDLALYGIRNCLQHGPLPSIKPGSEESLWPSRVFVRMN